MIIIKNKFLRKKILFISFLDFKEKSIQVIKKTPEIYSRKNWNVDYVVLRDNSKLDNYYYENEINPKNVNVYRTYLPFVNLLNFFKNVIFIRRILQKFFYFFGIFKVINFIKKNNIHKKKYDVLYGYEVYGVIVIWIFKKLGFFKNSKIIHRFQGSFLYDYITKINLPKLISNFDHLFAISLKADSYIITDDGTQGDKLFKLLNKKEYYKLKFWRNGVNKILIKKNILDTRFSKNKVIFLTVSRLIKWKRVDRAINLFKKLNMKVPSKLIIVGDGNDKNNLQNLVKKLNIKRDVIFTGPVLSSKVKYYHHLCDVFLSFYERSNLGNPLLESIRMNKLIVTLNNGDTGKLIRHKLNGLIYDYTKINYGTITEDILEILNNKSTHIRLLKNLKKIELEKLKTWKKRMEIEFEYVDSLIDD